MRRFVLLGTTLLLASAGCDTSVLGPDPFRQPDDRSEPQPTEQLDGRWRAVKWTVTNPYQESVDVLALGGRLELDVDGRESSGIIVIPEGIPGFWPETAQLNGVVLAIGRNATFRLVQPSFVSRAPWSFGEKHLAVVRYEENALEISVMLQRE